MGKVENAVRWMETKANDNRYGYLWGGWGPTDWDCGHFIIDAFEESGIPVKSRGGATYTENMYEAFMSCGAQDVTSKVNLKTGAGMIRGDVLINKTDHAAVYIGGGRLVHARSGEGNTIPGDQSGNEIRTQKYFNFPWDKVCRIPEDTVYDAIIEEEQPTFESDLDADSEFGPLTEGTLKDFQRAHGLTDDGLAGAATWSKIAEIIGSRVTRNGDVGWVVTALQAALNAVSEIENFY